MTITICIVALRKESVDRNVAGNWRLAMNLVALRKESVDRNINFSGGAGQLIKSSLSARRAWIEIIFWICRMFSFAVALRKESVDRNDTMQIVIVVVNGRSPQGERG